MELNGLEQFELFNFYFRLGVLNAKLENQNKSNNLNLASSRCFNKYINTVFNKMYSINKEKSVTSYVCKDQAENISIIEITINLKFLKELYLSKENDQSVELIKILFCMFVGFVILRESEQMIKSKRALFQYLTTYSNLIIAQEIKNMNI